MAVATGAVEKVSVVERGTTSARASGVDIAIGISGVDIAIGIDDVGADGIKEDAIGVEPCCCEVRVKGTLYVDGCTTGLGVQCG